MKNFKMKRFFIILFVLVMASSCTGKDGTLDLRKPYSLDLTPPEGPIEYEQGWSDGCETGSSAYTGNFYRLLRVYELRLDVKLRDDKMYYQAWRDAFLYCAIYWETINRSGL